MSETSPVSGALSPEVYATVRLGRAPLLGGALALPSASSLAFVFVLIKDKTDQTWTKLLSNQALNREPTI